MNRDNDSIVNAIYNLAEKLEIEVPADLDIAGRINYIADQYEPKDDGPLNATLVITVAEDDETLAHPTYNLVCDDPDKFLADYFDLSTPRIEPVIVLHVVGTSGNIDMPFHVDTATMATDSSGSTTVITAKLIPFDENKYYKYVSWTRANGQDTFSIFYK